MVPSTIETTSVAEMLVVAVSEMEVASATMAGVLEAETVVEGADGLIEDVEAVEVDTVVAASEVVDDSKEVFPKIK